ncbi:hypothetical protein [Kaistia defluvii]|uniref:Uncharacterized protein n=1 Tax=Kaistia defluvii TaxID=410841 RepID=A0ABV2QZI5_9HYPH
MQGRRIADARIVDQDVDRPLRTRSLDDRLGCILGGEVLNERNTALRPQSGQSLCILVYGQDASACDSEGNANSASNRSAGACYNSGTTVQHVYGENVLFRFDENSARTNYTVATGVSGDPKEPGKRSSEDVGKKRLRP